jgi:hypothetical protein
VYQVRSEDGSTEHEVTGAYNANTPTFFTDHGKVWILPDGTFEYVPNEDWDGDDSFQYQLIDGDGSTSDWATVTLHVPPPIEPASASFSLGLDELYAIDGEIDVFKWSLADLGNGDPVTKTVIGFNAGEGDQLDLRDLLQDGDNFLFDTDHLDVSYDGSNTVIVVSPVDATAPTLNIVLAGVDLVGGYEGQDVINQLLDNGNLLVDDK